MPSKTTVHVAIELSSSSWLVATRLPGAEKSRVRRIDGGDTTGLLALLADVRRQASTQLGAGVDVACCFEAGRDGFWLHRLLTAQGFASYVLEPTSILVNRRARRAKDRSARRRRHAARPRGLAGRRPAGVRHGAGPHT
jgi:transposase